MLSNGVHAFGVKFVRLGLCVKPTCGTSMTIVGTIASKGRVLGQSFDGIALMPIFYFAIKSAAHFPFTLLNHRWVARIGVYSYAMYLIHYIVINAIEKNAPQLATAKPLLVLVTFVVATLYAAILDVYVDSYFRRLRKKFH